MLVSKFSVRVTRYILLGNLKNVLVRYSSKNSCSGNINASCFPQENIGSQVKHSRCEENECGSKVSDIYLRALKSIEDYSKKLTKLVEDSLRPIQQEFEVGINQKKNEEAAKRQEISKTLDTKIWELINLNSTCGMRKKREVLMLNDKVFLKLKYWKCEEFEGTEILKTKIEELISETKLKTNDAINLLKSCRRCNSPNSLKDCVEKKAQEAMHILKCASEDTEKKVIDIQTYKNKSLTNFISTLEDITESYRKTMTKYSKDLNNFIDYTKRHDKVKRD